MNEEEDHRLRYGKTDSERGSTNMQSRNDRKKRKKKNLNPEGKEEEEEAAEGREGVWLGKRGNERGHRETDEGKEGVEHTEAMSHTWKPQGQQ